MVLGWIAECDDDLFTSPRIKDDDGHGRNPEPPDRKLEEQDASVPVNASSRL